MNADARRVFLEQRKKGLGGSDAAALLGIDRRKDIADVWRSKVGLDLTDDAPANDGAVRRGLRREESILDEYEDRFGVKLWRPSPTSGPFVHPEHPWMLANPDALVTKTGGAIVLYGVDAKSTIESIADEEYGREDTDEIPDEHVAQGQWYMGAFGVDRWDFEVEIATRWKWEYRRFIVRRSDALIAELIRRGDVLWNQHVLTGIPPEPNSIPAMERLARARFPYATAPEIVTDDPATIQLVRDYADAKDAKKAAEDALATAEARLKSVIGAAAGVSTPIGTVTWTPTRSGARPMKFRSDKRRSTS